MTDYSFERSDKQESSTNLPVIMGGDRSKPKVYRVKLKNPEDYYTNDKDLYIRPELLQEAITSFESVGFLCYMLLFPPQELWTAGKLTLSGKSGIEACASNLKKICQAGYIELLNLPDSFGWVYLIETEVNGVVRHKIGESIDPYGRFEDIQAHSPVKLTLKHVIQSQSRKSLEFLLHKKYNASRIQLGRKKGEWFELSPFEVEEILKMEGEHND